MQKILRVKIKYDQHKAMERTLYDTNQGKLLQELLFIRELVTPGVKINMHHSQNLQLCCSWASKTIFLLTWGAVADDISKWTGCEL